jgi:hypothetical protein
VGTELTVRDQASLFALLVVARPVTNRELRNLAGVEITAEVRRRTNQGIELIATTKQGAINTHRLTSAGRRWCEAALVAGRPDGAKFPAGVLFAVLEGVGQYLARSEIAVEEFFAPDLENWIRAAYTQLTFRRPADSWIKMSALRAVLDEVPRELIDAELDRMVELPDVHLMAELVQSSLTADDRKAAVEIGGEPRHLLRIGPA